MKRERDFRKSGSRFNVVLFVMIIFLGFGLWWYSQGELYCFFYPSIETKYAPGFSEKRFHRISAGMTTNEVEVTLGKPIHILPLNGLELWEYTSERSLPFVDFAWLRREITISNGIVLAVDSSIAHD